MGMGDLPVSASGGRCSQPKPLRAVLSAGTAQPTTPARSRTHVLEEKPFSAFRLKRRVPSGIYRGKRGPNPPPALRCLTGFKGPCRGGNRQVPPAGSSGALRAGAGRYLQAQLPALLGRQPAVQLPCKARRRSVSRGGRSPPSLTLHPSPRIAHPASRLLHRPPAPARPPSLTFHPASLTLHPASLTL